MEIVDSLYVRESTQEISLRRGYCIAQGVAKNGQSDGPPLHEGSILRDASRSLSSGAHSRDPLAMLLQDKVSVLMVRSASSRVSNHDAAPEAYRFG